MMSLWDALRMNMMISYQELVRTFLSFKMKEAHSKSLLSMGIQDSFEYCVDKHEPDSELALKIINERRQKINDLLGIDDQ